MESVFTAFRAAYAERNGYALSQTLSPIAPTTQPDRLVTFYQSTNSANVKRDVQRSIPVTFQFASEENKGWVEVYAAYWKAVGAILDAEAGGNSKV